MFNIRAVQYGRTRAFFSSFLTSQVLYYCIHITCAHAHTHVCWRWGREQSCTLIVQIISRTLGRGKGYEKDLVGGNTQRLFLFSKEDSGQAGSLEFRGKTAPGEEPSLTGLIPAPLLTQSHKLTPDSPDRLREAGNWSSAHLLRSCRRGGGES